MADEQQEKKPKRLIGVFDMPPLEGMTDEEIEARSAKLADEIAAAMIEADKGRGRSDEGA